MDDFNPYAAPETPVSLPGLATEVEEGRGVWRDGKTLVMAKVARLPSRCVKCNEPATFRLERTLYWHSPYYYFLLFLLVFLLLGLILYVIVVLIVRESATIQVPLCARHRARRLRAIWTLWFVALSGIALCFAPAFNSDLVPLVGLGVLMILGAVLGALSVAVVTPKKIDKTHVWLDKAGPLYLASLPSLPGGEDDEEEDEDERRPFDKD